MANTFKAVVGVLFGSGGMVGVNGQRHETYAGTGVGFAKSPLKAVKIARTRALAKIGDGACWCELAGYERVTDGVSGKRVHFSMD